MLELTAAVVTLSKAIRDQAGLFLLVFSWSILCSEAMDQVAQPRREIPSSEATESAPVQSLPIIPEKWASQGFI